MISFDLKLSLILRTLHFITTTFKYFFLPLSKELLRHKIYNSEVCQPFTWNQEVLYLPWLAKMGLQHFSYFSWPMDGKEDGFNTLRLTLIPLNIRLYTEMKLRWKFKRKEIIKGYKKNDKTQWKKSQTLIFISWWWWRH